MTLISPTPFLWHTTALKVFFSHPTDHLYTGECFGDDVGDVKFVSCGFLKSPLYFKQTQAVWLFLTGHVF